MTGRLTHQLHRVFAIAAMTVWLASGWPVLQNLMTGGTIRGRLVPTLWLLPFAIFGAAVSAAMLPKLRSGLVWPLLGVQLAAVIAMATIVPWAGMSQFLLVIAWQVAMVTTPARALVWVVVQTAAIIGTLAQALNPDLCWVIAKSFALQLLLVFTARALRGEAEVARALTETNRELRSAQGIIANSVRHAERLRISRELHDAWGHELTALGLQLEIASHLDEPDRARDHVLKAKGLSRDLLAKVRDVVATLREAERCELRVALEAIAQSVPRPAIQLEITSGVRVGRDQAHALVRCAQEAVTNAVRHSEATKLWLKVWPEGDGVRLLARDNGGAGSAPCTIGTGLLGMRERVESLGGSLAVRPGADCGFTVDAWLPSAAPQIA